MIKFKLSPKTHRIFSSVCVIAAVIAAFLIDPASPLKLSVGLTLGTVAGALSVLVYFANVNFESNRSSVAAANNPATHISEQVERQTLSGAYVHTFLNAGYYASIVGDRSLRRKYNEKLFRHMISGAQFDPGHYAVSNKGNKISVIPSNPLIHSFEVVDWDSFTTSEPILKKTTKGSEEVIVPSWYDDVYGAGGRKERLAS